MKNAKVLVTGGLGYIGSHTCVQMIEQGMQPIILDNLCNANPEVLNRIETITGTKPIFYVGDVRNSKILDTIFAEHKIASVIHFAGLKAVGESVQNRLSTMTIMLMVLGFNHINAKAGVKASFLVLPRRCMVILKKYR